MMTWCCIQTKAAYSSSHPAECMLSPSLVLHTRVSLPSRWQEVIAPGVDGLAKPLGPPPGLLRHAALHGLR
jgi:hypothetical protein